MDGDVFDNNEIIFCDKCNVAVHQQCYGVITIPEGEWLCEVCAAGEDPATTTCELCSNTGGAYKPVDRPGKWIHSLCATWVPEVFVSENNGNSIYTLSHLDKKRFKLKCTLCNTSKGASVQCSYGKCVTPAHPWCAIHMPEKGDFIVRSYILYTHPFNTSSHTTPFQHIFLHMLNASHHTPHSHTLIPLTHPITAIHPIIPPTYPSPSPTLYHPPLLHPSTLTHCLSLLPLVNPYQQDSLGVLSKMKTEKRCGKFSARYHIASTHCLHTLDQYI